MVIAKKALHLPHHTLATPGTRRHGRASVQIIIEDNGQGFDVEKSLSNTTGRGLNSQLHRVHAAYVVLAVAAGGFSGCADGSSREPDPPALITTDASSYQISSK